MPYFGDDDREDVVSGVYKVTDRTQRLWTEPRQRADAVRRFVVQARGFWMFTFGWFPASPS